MKWPFRKRVQQFDIPVEFTTHICPYELEYGPDNSKVVIHIHLPSRRVSETHYNSQGKIKQHIHSSPMAEEHIKFICSQDTKLEHLIQVAESMKENCDYINNRREIRNNTFKVIKCLCICYIVGAGYVLWKIIF